MSLTGQSDVDIIVTLGPKPLTDSVLLGLIENGATLLRINGSHESIKNILYNIHYIKSHFVDRIKILVDLPGNKIRLKGLSQPLPVRLGECLDLFAYQFSYPPFLGLLIEGEELTAHDGLMRFEVLKATPEKVVLRAKTSGTLENNKGLQSARSLKSIPFLLEKDFEILQLIQKVPIDFLGISYVRGVHDIEIVRGYMQGIDTKLLVKIETREAIRSLEAILSQSEQVLVDRGDLAGHIGLLNIPEAQSLVLQKAKEKGVKVALATQFLQSMVERDIPLIAEVEALYHAVRSGAAAIQLSEETSRGAFAEKAIRVVAEIIPIALKPSEKIFSDASFA